VRFHRFNGSCGSFGSRWKVGDIVGCAVDIDNRKVAFSLNGSWAAPWGDAFSDVEFQGKVLPVLYLRISCCVKDVTPFIS
jgi:hypothetical protein